MKIVNGEPCTIQGPNSAVALHVPKGVHGEILAKVHTNNFQHFIHHIPKNHCLVSPVCEYHLQPSLYNSSPHIGKFKIQIRHIVKDIEKVQPHIKVRYGNLHKGELENAKHLHQHQSDTVQYDINEKFVTINTRHFTGYMVTAESINCCAQSAYVLLFGSLTNVPQDVPLAAVKIYFSSTHNSIEDYIAVG